MAGTIQKTTIPIFLLTFISLSPVLSCGGKRQFNSLLIYRSITILDNQVKKKLLTLQGKRIWKNKIKINHFKAPDQFQRQHYFINAFTLTYFEGG